MKMFMYKKKEEKKLAWSPRPRLVLVGWLQLEPLLLLLFLDGDGLLPLLLEPALPASHAEAAGGADSGDDDRRGHGHLRPKNTRPRWGGGGYFIGYLPL